MDFIGESDGHYLRHPWEPAERVVTSAPAGAWVSLQRGVQRLVAQPDTALAKVYALATDRGHTPLLPRACEAEAAQWGREPGIDDAQLEDLTGLPFCTIDYTHSQDLDQALYVEQAGDGHIAWYALADTAHYVRPGSALFEEALRRGATYYLPGLTIPMLPLSLCEDLISLRAGVDRRALVLRMVVDAHGVCTHTEVLRARIHSRAKLAYDGVQAWLDGGARPTTDEDVLNSLRQLAVLGEHRLADAESRNVVRYRRREVDVSLDGFGSTFMARTSLRNDVERYSEQLSLLTNVEGARWLARQDTPDDDLQPIYRTNAPPEPQRLAQLQAWVAQVVQTNALPDSWRWPGPEVESLARYLRRLPHPHPIARAIEFQAMFTGGRAGFSAEPAEHHGVGADVYARFTAPMREMVGIFLHKETAELLGDQVSPAPAADDRLREQVIEAARRARNEQRALTSETNRRVLDRMFQRDQTQHRVRSGVVLELSSRRVRVQLDEPAIDVKLYVAHLARERGPLRAAARETELVDKRDRRVCAVGQSVGVRVHGLDAARNRWQLDLCEPPAPPR